MPHRLRHKTNNPRIRLDATKSKQPEALRLQLIIYRAEERGPSVQAEDRRLGFQLVTPPRRLDGACLCSDSGRSLL